jgi:hypothetical protein
MERGAIQEPASLSLIPRFRGACPEQSRRAASGLRCFRVELLQDSYRSIKRCSCRSKRLVAFSVDTLQGARLQRERDSLRNSERN